MAKTENLTVSPVVADELVKRAAGGYYPGTGTRVYREADDCIELYGGNSNDRAKIAATAAAMERELAREMLADPEPATPRQISYLSKLIDQDPANAMDLGASLDGVRPIENLSKDAASKLITQLKNA